MSRGRQHKQYLARAHAMGGHTTVPAGETVQVLIDLHQRMSMTAIARGIGTSHNYVSKVMRGHLKRMSPERHAAIMALRGYQPTDTSHIDVTGARRRLQSLHALGYSLARIEREVGCYSLGAIKDLVHGRTPVMEAQHASAIAAAYERLSMRLPVAANKYEAGGITRARNTARRNGWPPPLAWDDIDDPDERPVGWHYQPATRADTFAELTERGVTVTEACQLLKVSREGLEKWADRAGLRPEFNAMTARETAVFEQRNRYSA